MISPFSYEQGRQPLDALLRRTAVEVHGLSDLARQLDEALGTLAHTSTESAPIVLQEIDLLRQSLDDVTALLRFFATETDGSIQIETQSLSSLLQLHDLRHRLLHDGAAPTPRQPAEPSGTPHFFD
ncbi:hypothetical protein SAMN04490248_106186 [Salinihabitans flavidus]|uniref:Uncharacterized protein n=1 Tax=Salinihabitans flavidus TaxID=569882 RepID=A0A1H8QK83_9RHOB|nr:hypothetical protein SAMN04490248_106186 [Salinihabitans flavidus]